MQIQASIAKYFCSTLVWIHRCVKVKLGKIIVVLNIFLNKTTFDCFINLSPLFTIFSIFFWTMMI